MLLCRSPLLPGESLPSLLIRLTKLNRYSSTMLPRLCLANASGFHIEHPTQPVLFQHLADLTQLDPIQLYQATRHVFASILSPPGVEPELLALPSGETLSLLHRRLVGLHLHRDTAAQFCPHCLQESAYHRLIWLPVAVAACLKHRCLLLPGCPACHQALSIREIVDTRCRRCQADLKQAPPSYLEIDPVGLSAQQIIQAWLTHSVSSELVRLKLPPQPVQGLYHVLDGLCLSIRQVEGSWPYRHQPDLVLPVFPEYGLASPRMTPSESYIAYTTAFKAMVNWPAGFYEFLEAYRCRRGEPVTRNLPTDLGNLYQTWLQKRWQHPAFQFIQEVFDQYLLDHYPRSMAVIRSRRYWSNPAFARKFAFMPVAEAARLLDTLSTQVYWLIQSGDLTAYEAQEESHRFPLVKRTEVLLAGHKNGLFLSIAETARLLGIPTKVVADLLNARSFKAEYIPETEEWLVAKKNVEYYRSRLAHQVIAAIWDPPKSPIDLTTATEMLSELGLNEADIFNSIMDGKLKSYCYEPYLRDLGKLVFTKAHIRAYIRKAKKQKTPPGENEPPG